MVVEEKNANKMYSFYVSDFHLEMILVPFINNKIEENENVIIKTEYDLEDTLKVLLTRLNIKEEEKDKILKLDWNKNNNKRLENNSNIIIVGNQKYIKDINDEIKKEDLADVTIVDCYKLEEIKNKKEDIINQYDFNLNTIGYKSIKNLDKTVELYNK